MASFSTDPHHPIEQCIKSFVYVELAIVTGMMFIPDTRHGIPTARHEEIVPRIECDVRLPNLSGLTAPAPLLIG